MNQNFGSPFVLDPRIISHVESKIGSTKIFVVSKIKCGACKKAKALLNKLVAGTGVTPAVFEIDNYPRQYAKMIMKYLVAQTGIKTVPQIWINGKFVGGNDDIQRLHREGRLVSLIGMKTRRGSKLSTNYLSTTLLVSPINAELFPKHIRETKPVVSTPVLHMHGDNAGENMRRRGCCARRSSLPHGPSTYTIDEDIKWDMAEQNLKEQNKWTVLQQQSRPRATFISYNGNNLPNSSSRVSSRNWLLPSPTQRSALHRVEEIKSTKYNWFCNEPIITRPSNLVQPCRSRRNGVPETIVIGNWV